MACTMTNISRIFLTLMCVLVGQSIGIPLSVENYRSRFIRSLSNNNHLVDLGVDMSDDFAPSHLLKALQEAIDTNNTSYHQYADIIGQPRLRKALAALYSRVIGYELDPDKNMLVTVGATEAIHISFEALTEPGDEWIIIEPFFPKYEPSVRLAGGIPRFSPMILTKKSGEIRGSDWILDKENIKSLFNNKTKGIILNNPNNPTGKLLTLDELTFIADLVKKHNAYVIADDAHEWVLFDPVKTPFIRMVELPEMFERTITIGSASKSLTVAGWRLGWAYGPANLIKRLATVHSNVVTSAATILQEALAIGIEMEVQNYGTPASHFVINSREVKAKQDFMYQAFLDAGMIPMRPDGGYCMLAKWPKFLEHQELYANQEPGDAFAKFLNEKIDIIGFPMSDYYGQEHRSLAQDNVRFCLQKTNKTLMNAAENLKRLVTF